jgi:cysteinyl-tRNA synthetase
MTEATNSTSLSMTGLSVTEATLPNSKQEEEKQEEEENSNNNNSNNSNNNNNNKQPPWHQPSPTHITHETGLTVLNSLTRSKDLFLTQTGSSQVTWYMCGPTVYAPSHMGHARTYLGFDILRRILQDYFQYKVTLIMNITDIDDKIIERAREQGMTSTELSRKFEQDFHQDMQALGVQPPTVVTRVTEYMEEIVTYIQNICDKGLAYESNGSVYFNVKAFEATPGMHYCKLEPEQVLNAQLLAEGEGKLTQTQDFVNDKQSPRDFALWKKSKANEPQWESPWGPGRPGWHIECSAMATDVLQQLAGTKTMDIHSGGIDLKFPHHDNEMAQAEAECGACQWVNYFVHAGHLHIKGFKMSKSLKNFITIQEALENNTARQIRLLFLLHKYNAPMDYGDNTMSHAVITEKGFAEFFHNCKACLRQYDMQQSQKWSVQAVQLQTTLAAAMTKVDDALKDDFDTPTVLAVLGDLVKATNLYMNGSAGTGDNNNNDKYQIVGLVVRNVAAFITRMFQTFGLIFNDTLGFVAADDGAGGGNAGGDSSSREQILQPVLDALMGFRAAVRDKARSQDIGAVLGLCDEFRDSLLPPLGIRLEDKADGSVWKLADPAELIREMEQRDLEVQRKAEIKLQRAADEAAKEALNKLSPQDFMKQLTMDVEGTTTSVYTKFDDAGMPTHDSQGEPLNKTQGKKALKAFQTQEKKYEKYMKSQE